jgi:hypothetical protein
VIEIEREREAFVSASLDTKELVLETTNVPQVFCASISYTLEVSYLTPVGAITNLRR